MEGGDHNGDNGEEEDEGFGFDAVYGDPGK
jgi:hypothetical protein